RAGTFSLTGAIDPARQYHSATLLTDGKVLIAGGYSSGGIGWLVDSQLFDPQKEDFINTGRLDKGDFILTGRLITRRDAHTATLLPYNRQTLRIARRDRRGLSRLLKLV